MQIEKYKNYTAVDFLRWQLFSVAEEYPVLESKIKGRFIYYGIKIQCDAVMAELKCSGKLNLKNDLNRLLAELSRALSVKYRQNVDGSYTINVKS